MVIRLGPGAEFDLIRRFLDDAPGEGPGVRVGPGGDCAIVTGEGIALTVDMAVEDVHFRRGWLEPDELGYHAATGAISDLAAVAARPIGILASVALGPGDERGAGMGVMEGVTAAARDHGAVLLGGDLTRSPGPLVVDVVAVGDVGAAGVAEPLLRSGARTGDEVWVTGELGAAAAAVEAWLRGDEPEPAARAAYARPRARTREALWLRERQVPTAMVDLSDGLAGDAGHIAAASGVRIRMEAAALPVAPAAGGADGGRAIRLAAAGGEDYELCFTAPPGTVDRGLVRSFEEAFGVRLTRVGAVEAAGEEGATGAVVVDEHGAELRLEAFQHWRDG